MGICERVCIFSDEYSSMPLSHRFTVPDGETSSNFIWVSIIFLTVLVFIWYILVVISFRRIVVIFFFFCSGDTVFSKMTSFFIVLYAKIDFFQSLRLESCVVENRILVKKKPKIHKREISHLRFSCIITITWTSKREKKRWEIFLIRS